MRAEIITRINTIITNDSALTGVFRTYENEYPASIQAPCTLILPRQDSGYRASGGNRFVTEPQFDIRVYLESSGLRLTTINNIEAVIFPDLFATAFLSRPQLQYNDLALNGVVNSLTFQIVSDLARPLDYPIGVQGAPRFWGFIARLTVPYRQVIALKVDGI